MTSLSKMGLTTNDILDETLKREERAALEEFARRVRARFADRVAMIRLFGSRARGDFHEDSDIDAMVVLRGPAGWPERQEVIRIAADVGLAGPGYVDIMPKTIAEDEFRRLLREEWRIALDVEREGIPL